ncbi:MAG: sortase [Candidatus Pacebacteria bacterium]|nr:sortase [Candidatus Paceibacterota bacterium]
MKRNKINLISKSKIPEALVALGIFLMFISGVYWTLRFRALSLDNELLAQYEQQAEVRPNRPTHIFIEWFIDTPIETQILQDNHWTISEKEASYLDQSARPGEAGNIIIYGHNTRKILGNIRALQGNEEILVTTDDGEEHVYTIETIVEVDPSQTKYLEPTEEETLTLYTCSGFFDKQRFIIQAKPQKL